MSFLSPPQGFQATSVTGAAFPLLGSDGSAAAPTYSFSSSGNSDNGLYLSAANVPAIAAAGAGILFVSADVVEQRNSTTAQTLRVYNTFTDASNYERGNIRWASNVLEIVTEGAGTGATTRALTLGADGNGQIGFTQGGSVRWLISTSQHLQPGSNNVYDLGLTGTRVRTGYFGTSVDVVSSAVLLDTNGITMGDAKNIILNATTGTKIGTATSQKLGFFNATPVVQPTGIANADGTLADITTKFNTLLNTIIETLGLSSTV